LIILVLIVACSPKKMTIQNKIVDDDHYCAGRDTDLYNTDCICQEGYIRVNEELGKSDCYPKLCAKLDGRTWAGDEGIPHAQFCAIAVRTNSSNICSSIDDQENRDICYLAVFGKMDDRQLCEYIVNLKIKEECMS